MGVLKKLVVLLCVLVALSASSFATQEQLDVLLLEDVNQQVTFNPLIGAGGSGLWEDADENQSNYSITGRIIVTNNNPNSKTISDILVSLSNTTNLLGVPEYLDGRTGTFISANISSNLIILHIPELRAGENATFNYTINSTLIRPPLNFTSNYSATKILAGDDINVTDNVQNYYDNQTSETCIYNINISQVQSHVNFNGVPYNFTFVPNTTIGTDYAAQGNNVTYQFPDNQSHYWYVRGGECLNKFDQENITYTMQTPLNIPGTTSYAMINSTLEYQLNNSASQMKIVDIEALSEANLTFEKRIVGPSDPLLFGSNVTWNVTGYFSTETNISYNLTQVTFWVSQRNVNGSYTDPNTRDNDTINGSLLNVTYNPYYVVNATQSYTSGNWLFNYSDIPSPIVWMNASFEIVNDGTQLINRSITRNGSDIYIKELYLIIGYWLQIEKNVTNIAQDRYYIKIDVKNRGNQVTPADTIVTIYDFIPANFTLLGGFNYTVTTTWYNTSESNTTINGTTGPYNGTLYQFALIPNNPLNTSFDAGPAETVNTTWTAEYNVTGTGDYTLLDIFVTGLDPQQVDGAGSTQGVVVSQVIDRLKSTEGIFAAVAGILLLLGLLV